MIDGDGPVSSTKLLSDLETSGHKLLSDAAQLNVTRWKFARMDPNDKSSSPDTALERGWREAEEIAGIADSLACRHALKNCSRVTAVNSEEAIKSRLNAE